MGMSNLQYARESGHESAHHLEIRVKVLVDEWEIFPPEFPLDREHVGEDPGLVLEVVDGRQGVDRVETPVHEGQEGVLVVTPSVAEVLPD